MLEMMRTPSDLAGTAESASSALCGMVSNPTNQNGTVTKTAIIPTAIVLKSLP